MAKRTLAAFAVDGGVEIVVQSVPIAVAGGEIVSPIAD
jgi:hypothetical protein